MAGSFIQFDVKEAGSTLDLFESIVQQVIAMTRAERKIMMYELNRVRDPSHNYPFQPSVHVLGAVQRLCMRDGSLNSMDALVDEVATTMRCYCRDVFGSEMHRRCVDHFLRVFGDKPHCDEEARLIEFYTIERRMPTVDEYSHYSSHLSEYKEDSEQYSIKYRTHTPTPNLSLLQELKKSNTPEDLKNDGLWTCALCQDDIQEFYYALPCKHRYHSRPEDCLDKTVKDWLMERRTCPFCNTEVKISQEEVDAEKNRQTTLRRSRRLMEMSASKKKKQKT